MSMKSFELHPRTCPDCGEIECICNNDHRLRHDPPENNPYTPEEEDSEVEDSDD